jgi:hypothetical protein
MICLTCSIQADILQEPRILCECIRVYSPLANTRITPHLFVCVQCILPCVIDVRCFLVFTLGINTNTFHEKKPLKKPHKKKPQKKNHKNSSTVIFNSNLSLSEDEREKGPISCIEVGQLQMSGSEHRSPRLPPCRAGLR